MPLHIATANGMKDVVLELIGRGADTGIRTVDYHGCTAQSHAAICKNADIIDILASSGTDVNDRSLHDAA